MTQFKLTGFRFNKLQWIAEKATQKMVLYLQPEIKNELKSMSRSTFKILFYANKSKEKNGIVPIMGRVTINGFL